MSTRKRSRQSLLESQEEDELSPTKDTSKEKEILGTIKRRKLNTYGSLPASRTLTPEGKGIIGSLKGLFGYSAGKGKENTRSEDVDELSGDIWDVPEDTGHAVSRRKSARGKAVIKETEDSAMKDIWEVNVSGSGDDGGVPVKARGKPGPKMIQKPIVQNNGDEEPVTLKRSVGRPRKGAEDTTSKKGGASHGPSSGRHTSGRPRKSDILKKAKALSRKAVRNRLSQPEEPEEEAQSSKPKSPRQRSRKTKDYAEIVDADTGNLEAASVAPRRDRPKRLLEEDADSAATPPKGILTPSKDRGVRSRKSVVFEASVDLGFKDIPNSTTKKSKTQGHVQADADAHIRKEPPLVHNDVSLSEEDADSDTSDDVACVICDGLDSEVPNEILFCDNCDKAVHQLCYNVPVVPDDDWLCRDCRPDANELLELDLGKGIDALETQNDIPDIEGFEGHLQNMQRLVLDKLTGQKRIKLTGHSEEMHKVTQVVEQTILAGEGNSMLIIGARGCGKSNLVESVIDDLSVDHREKFHVVRLSGFIHTDDKLALKEIWRQLGREMEIDDDLTTKSNHADTLASLLALLSHPSEISENQDGQTAKSVVFILDEFDLFTTHARQTLLYNLFDIAQARKAPIAVLGLTTRVDVVEALEKRVKSRFSHRYVHLSLPQSLPAYWEICLAGLTSDSAEFDVAGFDTVVRGLEEFISYWHAMINDLYNKDAAFKHHLQSNFYRTKSVSSFLASCIIPIANLSAKNNRLFGRSFSAYSVALSAPDSKLHILQGLSDLELALLIAAARLDIILDTDTCNFSMAYDEYSSLTSRHKIQTSSTGLSALGASAKVWGREVALGAWERLATYDLLVPAGIGGGSARDFGTGGRMWKADVGLEEITGSVDGLSGVMAKWCREI